MCPLWWEGAIEGLILKLIFSFSLTLLGRAIIPPKPLANDCVNDSEPSNTPSIAVISLNKSNDNNVLGDYINGQHSRENAVDK